MIIIDNSPVSFPALGWCRLFRF